MKTTCNIVIVLLLTVFLIQTALGQSEADSTSVKDELTDSVKTKSVGPLDPYYFGTYKLQPVQKPHDYNLSIEERQSLAYPNYVQSYHREGPSPDPAELLITGILQNLFTQWNQKKQEEGIEHSLFIDK